MSRSTNTTRWVDCPFTPQELHWPRLPWIRCRVPVHRHPGGVCFDRDVGEIYVDLGEATARMPPVGSSMT